MARSQNGCPIRYAGMTGFDEIDVVFTSAEAHNRNAARLGSHHRAAISRVVPVAYAEVVASITSLSVGPGTRSNIDEFTETTSEAIEQVGGTGRGKAIIVLNPIFPWSCEIRSWPLYTSPMSPSRRELSATALDPVGDFWRFGRRGRRIGCSSSTGTGRQFSLTAPHASGNRDLKFTPRVD